MKCIDADKLIYKLNKWLEELKQSQNQDYYTVGSIEALECCIAEIESMSTTNNFVLNLTRNLTDEEAAVFEEIYNQEAILTGFSLNIDNNNNV